MAMPQWDPLLPAAAFTPAPAVGARLARKGTIILLVALGCSCGERSAEPKGGTTGLGAGAVLIDNGPTSIWKPQDAWKTVIDLQLGAGQKAQLQTPGAIAVDASGEIYVLSRETQDISVFDSGGSHVRTFAGRGEGPGALTDASGMDWDPRGRLWVVDPGGRRYCIFERDGRYVGSHTRDAHFNEYPWRGVVLASGQVVDVAARPGGPPFAPILVIWDSLLQHADSYALPQYPLETFELHKGKTVVSAPIPFTPRLTWIVDRSGWLWYAYTGAYRLYQHRLGGVIAYERTVQRTSSPVFITKPEKEAAIADLQWFVNRGGHIDRRKIPSTKPALDGILGADDIGYLWVTRTVPYGETGSVFDIFDPDGRYLGKVHADFQLDSGVRPVFRRGYLYGILRKSSGSYRLIRARIIRSRYY
jgi:hypothetical protein